MRRTGAVVALGAAGFLLSPLSPMSGADSPTNPSPDVQVRTAQPPRTDLSRVKPPLTPNLPRSTGVAAELKGLADRVMSTDPALNAMIEGQYYSIVNEGVWTRPESHSRLGVVREIKLAKPVDTPMYRWPVVIWPDKGDDYQAHQFHAQYRGVSMISVYIDDKVGVVQLVPHGELKVLPGPDNDWIASLPTGQGE